MSIENKVILVTGSSRGIGKQVAMLLAEHGAKVIINYANSEDEANETVENITSKDGTAIAIKADVSQKKQVVQMFDKAIDKFGQIDVLINNAGIMINELLKDHSQEEFTKLFDINVRGVFNTLQEADSKLSDNGIIINFSSSTTKLMMPKYALYSSTKSAVEQITRVYAKEIGRGVSVNAIAPGGTNTELFNKNKSQEAIDKLSAKSAFNRIAEPSDIAKVVLFLASDDSKWISGQVIYANGALI